MRRGPRSCRRWRGDEDTFAFHGHRCWASAAGVRAGQATLRSLVRFVVCPACHELVAEPYLPIVAGEQRCLAGSGYPH